MYYEDTLEHGDDGRLEVSVPLTSCTPTNHYYELSDDESTLTFDLTIYINPNLKGVDKNHWSNKIKAFGVLSEFNNCCGIIIASTISTKLSLDIAVELAERMGYSLILYAATDGQTTTINALKEKGFKRNKHADFNNIRTDNTVGIYSLILQQDIIV